jgi:hypothetical protein
MLASTPNVLNLIEFSVHVKRAEYELCVYKNCIGEVLNLLILQIVISILVSTCVSCQRPLGDNRWIRYSLLQHLNLPNHV